ncbi:hypothetical protein TSH7_09925 [Azospirillum sp. TSH7]|uniref:hypothetical protein n=1 Tax=unclassified Azospirillum TaxID=2630922 RepID=UPI000D6111CA|nr:MULTISPECIES: hypothetical protein [unclassified Azospirillum]PWC63986.1 hypothetical protein TSH20_19020 [Azospirillum sp. TSH20]PWC64849.1 hypothetical protein TSH7_09925 [Azospirillum sp. TSH7]
MTDHSKAPAGVQLRTNAYEDFSGLDATRDKNSLDIGKGQPLLALDNAFCDWRGQIVRDPGANKVAGGEGLIRCVTFATRDTLAWAEDGGDGVTLGSSRGSRLPGAFPKGAGVTTAAFNRRALFLSPGSVPLRFDGAKFEGFTGNVELKPAFGTAIQRRLAVAGIPGKPTEIWLSRVDEEGVHVADEPANSTNVLRAGTIDIGNLLGTNDEITGIGTVENNRLAVFTNDSVWVYIIDPDLTKWSVEDRAAVQVGTISHATICRAGTDLLFCARDGIYSLKRAAENGLVLYAEPLSSRIDNLYRRLVRSVPDPRRISAVWDQDTGQYHVFFPQAGIYCTRLTMTLPPAGVEGGPKWSMGSFLNARCGAALGGALVYGTSGGIWSLVRDEDVVGEQEPTATIITPMLWTGSLKDTKQGHSLILQASGVGAVQVDVIDDEQRPLTSLVVEIDADDREPFPDIPLERQYERQFPHRFRGVQLRFTIQGEARTRLIGFSLNTRKS